MLKGCPVKDFTCSNDECIPPERKCDGVADCADQSDENPISCKCYFHTYHHALYSIQISIVHGKTY